MEINSTTISLAILFIILIAVIFRSMNRVSEGIDNAADFVPSDASVPNPTNLAVTSPDTLPQAIKPSEPAELAPVMNSVPASAAPITPADLLPASPAAVDFNNQHPTGAGEENGKNFLVAGYNIGINTVASSLKNANLQFRSDPFIPRSDVLWNNSTIMASDVTNRKVLEIGS